MKFDINNFFGTIAFLISIIAIVINLKNRKTNINSYLISKDSHKRNSSNLLFIESKQFENEHIIKLAVFNSSSVSLFLNCLKVYKSVKIENKAANFFGYRAKWQRIDSRWWPSNNSEFTSQRFLNQEYENLLVDETKNIFVSIKGLIGQGYHKFELTTSFDEMTHITTIADSQISFNIDYKKKPIKS